VPATFAINNQHLQPYPHHQQPAAPGSHTGTHIPDVLVASSESSSTHATTPGLYKTTSNAASQYQQSSGCDSPLPSPRAGTTQDIAAAGQQAPVGQSQGQSRPGSQGAVQLAPQVVVPTHVLLSRPPRLPPADPSPFASGSPGYTMGPAPAAAAAASVFSAAGAPASVGPSPLGQPQQGAVNGTVTPPPISGRRSLHRDTSMENGSNSIGSGITGGSQTTYSSSRPGVTSPVNGVTKGVLTQDVLTSLRTASSSSLNPSYEQIASMMQLGGRGFSNGTSRLVPSGSLPAGSVAPAMHASPHAPSSPRHGGSGPVTPSLSQLSAEQIGRKISGGPSGRLGRLGSSSRPGSYEVATGAGGVVVGAGSSGGGGNA
jgi:hypothetical protein